MAGSFSWLCVLLAPVCCVHVNVGRLWIKRSTSPAVVVVMADAERRARAQDIYRRARQLSAAQLWLEEVPKFDAMEASRERDQAVGIVRAVGNKFASAEKDQRAAVRTWLLRLLDDPSERVQRYAITAISKVVDGDDCVAEQALLRVLRSAGSNERVRRSVSDALCRCGGAASLAANDSGGARLTGAGQQTLLARKARQEQPSSIVLDERMHSLDGLRVHLRCRRGLEVIVADEVHEAERRGLPLRVVAVNACCVVTQPTAAFTLAEAHSLRCFDTLSFLLASASTLSSGLVANAIASRRCEQLTRGPTRAGLLQP